MTGLPIRSVKRILPAVLAFVGGKFDQLALQLTAVRVAVAPSMRDLQARANALRDQNRCLIDRSTDGALRRTAASTLQAILAFGSAPPSAGSGKPGADSRAKVKRSLTLAQVLHNKAFTILVPI